MPRDPQALDAVFRLINRELWVVTAADGGRRGGLTATWVSQASIDEQTPAVLIGIAPNHFTAELIDAAGHFGLHLLQRDQVDVAWNFAHGSGRDRDKLAGYDLLPGATPVLRACLAWLRCRVFKRLDAGDRLYYWADVADGNMPGEGSPLCEHEFFAALSVEQQRYLREARLADLAVQRPLLAEWRRRGARE